MYVYISLHTLLDGCVYSCGRLQNYVGVAYITSKQNPVPAQDSDDSEEEESRGKHDTIDLSKGKGSQQQHIIHAQPDVRNGYFGYLKVCSRGIYFDPHDPAIPVYRFRYKDMVRQPHVEWNPPGCCSNDLVTTAEGRRDAGPCITFCISAATTMKRNF
eukprot:gb/GECG01012633.1/.p1 GENE.gb/GECG01012633.1/~~gb/GECG01012633.1/.p1  ORF type:complete len:158 (+),score=15.51 gb/GECG01012633.1/:1-474(+)